MLTILLASAGIGVLAGFLAGLLGIGGGLVIVPLLSWMLMHDSPEHAMHLALGTSLATILLTGLSSVIAHQRRGVVRWRLVSLLAPGLLLGAWLAGRHVAAVDDQLLSMVFAGFCVLAAMSLWQSGTLAVAYRVASFVHALVAVLIGGVSAVVGIGGGSLTVPWLHRSGVTIHQAIGTASACGLPIALAGALGYWVAGQTVEPLPAGSFGFIHGPAFVGIVSTSVLMAPVGAWCAHRLDRSSLQRVFSVLLLGVGVAMILR